MFTIPLDERDDMQRETTEMNERDALADDQRARYEEAIRCGACHEDALEAAMF